MPRNRKLELNSTVPGQWVTSDGRFAVLKKPKPINPMEGTFDFKIRYTFSIRDLRGEDTYPQFIQLAPEIAQLEKFKEVFPWLGQYTGEGSFDTEDPDRMVPKGVIEDVAGR